MSENEIKDMATIAEVYKELPPYLKGKIDGYAEAIKEKSTGENEEQPG